MTEEQREEPTIGRTTRLGFWKIIGPFIIALVAVDIYTGSPVQYTGFHAFVFVAFFAPLIWVQVGRWHDLGYSGWLLLLNFIPLVNFGVFLYLGFMRGKDERNKFGESPYQVESAENKET